MENVIEEIRVYKFPLPASTLYNMSSSKVATPESTIVEIIDSKGVSGYGEACMATPEAQPATNDSIRASLEILAPAILGLSSKNLTLVNSAMNDAVIGESESKAALDIACWDLKGKSLNKTISELLGGYGKKNVITYHVVGIGEPEHAADQARKLQNSGMRRIQLKTGGREIGKDIACIHAVAAVLNTKTVLDVDTNRGWSEEEAVEVSRACSSIVMSMEQPCATEEELHRIKPYLNHPLIVDESASDLPTVSRMIASGLADGFGMKITRLGGLTEMQEIRKVCVRNKVPMSSDDAWGGDIIATAGVALGATIPFDLNRGAWLAHTYHKTHYDEANGPHVENGYVKLPEGGPGLGLSIDMGFFGTPVSVYQKVRN